MSESRRLTPPLSPVLLAGLALRPLPPVSLQPFLTLAMAAMRRRHGDVFERLAFLGPCSFLIDASDLPFLFLLRLGADTPSLEALGAGRAVEATATIRGPLIRLIDLLEGRIDGDALFFSRELVIEGDSEAVVALRNAVDAAEIDLIGDVLSLLGPLALPVRHLIRGGTALLARAASDLETLRWAMIAPAMRRSDSLAADLRDLEQRLDRAPRGGRRAAVAKRP